MVRCETHALKWHAWKWIWPLWVSWNRYGCDCYSNEILFLSCHHLVLPWRLIILWESHGGRDGSFSPLHTSWALHTNTSGKSMSLSMPLSPISTHVSVNASLQALPLTFGALGRGTMVFLCTFCKFLCEQCTFNCLQLAMSSKCEYFGVDILCASRAFEQYIIYKFWWTRAKVLHETLPLFQLWRWKLVLLYNICWNRSPLQIELSYSWRQTREGHPFLSSRVSVRNSCSWPLSNFRFSRSFHFCVVIAWVVPQPRHPPLLHPFTAFTTSHFPLPPHPPSTSPQPTCLAAAFQQPHHYLAPPPHDTFWCDKAVGISPVASSHLTSSRRHVWPYGPARLKLPGPHAPPWCCNGRTVKCFYTRKMTNQMKLKDGSQTGLPLLAWLRKRGGGGILHGPPTVQCVHKSYSGGQGALAL